STYPRRCPALLVASKLTRSSTKNPGGQSLSYLTGEDDPNTTISSPQASPQSL
ncbi:hypothetical protein WG66_006076, partial [Moniliophthora roreri]